MRPLLVGIAAMVLVATACANGDDVADPTPVPDEPPGQPDILTGELHECAESLPVPDGLSVLTSGSAPAQDGSETCVTTLEAGESFEAVTASYRAALDDAGWEHSVEEEQPDVGNVLRMTAPECGFLLVVDGAAAGEMGLVEPQQAESSPTIAVAQTMDCDLLPPPAEE